MRAVTVAPGDKDSLELSTVDPVEPSETDTLVRMLAVGVCGTDREIIAGEHGQPPPGQHRLILGHESLGEIITAPDDSGLSPGDRVVGIVRRPDPVPCPNCAVGEWDMCTNGRYTERGIDGAHGYLAEQIALDPAYAVPVDDGLGIAGVLTEPASIVQKAWEHIEHIGRRARWRPRTVVVTGAGPIGLLAALLATQRDLDVHVFDRVETGPKPELTDALGATYHTGDLEDACRNADIVIEATGVPSLVFQAMQHTANNAIVCLTGVSSRGRRLDVPAGSIARELVLGNDVVFGTVNANRSHYERAAAALTEADTDWLSRLITRRVPLDEYADAYDHDPGTDIKTVIDVYAAP